MNTRLRRLCRLSAVTAVLAALTLGGTPVAAQEPQPQPTPTTTPPPDDSGIVHSWALTPGVVGNGGERAHFVYDLAPGGEAQDMATILNFSNVALTFTVYPTDAFNTDDGSFSLLASDEEPSDVGTWITLPFETVVVPAGQQLSFPITVNVPPDASPGDHVGAILASSVAQGTQPDGRIVNLDRRTGSRVYVRVAGPLDPELAVEDLQTTYTPSLNPLDGTAEITYRIVNRGNVRLKGTHAASVAGPFGLMRSSSETEELPELLPGESIEVSRTIEGVSATGLAFTDVDLQPIAPDGAEVDGIESSGRSGFTLAIPFTIVALLVVLVLAAFARRSYQRHRDDEGILVEHAAS